MNLKKMKNFFTLTRYGVINLKNSKSSEVQCAGVSHPLYKYGVGILYAEGLHLDSHGWLIDNNKIDEVVQKIEADSCELMLKHIMEGVVELLNKAGIPFIGVKVVVKPFIVADEKVAEFSLCALEDEKYTEEIFGMKVEIV